MRSPFLLKQRFEGGLMEAALRLDRPLEMCKLA